MIGDDPNSSVTTTRVGFRTVSDALERGSERGQQGQRVPVKVSEDEEEAATTSGCNFGKHDGNGVPMQCE